MVAVDSLVTVRARMVVSIQPPVRPAAGSLTRESICVMVANGIAIPFRYYPPFTACVAGDKTLSDIICACKLDSIFAFSIAIFAIFYVLHSNMYVKYMHGTLYGIVTINAQYLCHIIFAFYL